MLRLLLGLLLAFLMPSMAGAVERKVLATGGAATGDCLTWATAGTFSHAEAVASAGDALDLDGGADGRTYTSALTVTKPLLVRGSSDPGHDGLVTLTGGLVVSNPTGTATLQRMRVRVQTAGITPIVYINSPTVVWDQMVFTESRLEGADIVSGNPAHATFQRCYFRDNIRKYAATWSPQHPNAVNTTFQFCWFDWASVTAGAGGRYYNSTFTSSTAYGGRGTGGGMLGGANDVIATNCIFVGAAPVIPGPGMQIGSHVVWSGGNGQTECGFDTCTSCSNDPQPLFAGRRSGLGGTIIRVDDKDQIKPARNFAEDAEGTGIKLVIFSNGHSGTVPLSGDEVDDLRWLVKHGHEVGGHGASHHMFSSMAALDFSAQGAVPVSVTVEMPSRVVTNDSYTWNSAGNAKLRFTVGAATYDLGLAGKTLGQVVSDIHGRWYNGVTLQAALAPNAYFSAAAIQLAVSGPTTLPAILAFDEDAFIRYSFTENMMDVESWINSGCARNGVNSVTATTKELPPDPPYVVKVFASPQGQGSVKLRAAAAARGSMVACSRSDEAAGVLDLFPIAAGAPAGFDLMNIGCKQNESGSETYYLAAQGWAGGMWQYILFHGEPYYGGTAQGLIDLCRRYNTCNKTMSELVEELISSSKFAYDPATRRLTALDAGYDDLFGVRGDNRAAIADAATAVRNTGSDICALLGGDQYDLAGRQVCQDGVAIGPWADGVDIGAFAHGPDVDDQAPRAPTGFAAQ